MSLIKSSFIAKWMRTHYIQIRNKRSIRSCVQKRPWKFSFKLPSFKGLEHNLMVTNTGLYLQIRKSAENPATCSENCGILEFLCGIFGLTKNTLFLDKHINFYFFSRDQPRVYRFPWLLFLNQIDTGFNWYLTIKMASLLFERRKCEPNNTL